MRGYLRGIPAVLAYLGIEDVRLINTPFAVMVGIIYAYLPLMVFPIYVSLEKLDKRLLESSSDLGGTPIRDLRLHGLRQRVGMVTQDMQLFRATVRENLALFDAGVDDATILDAIESLGLLDWFQSLPQGLDTQITSGGLSAGESQLLAFARVFLRNPGLVILDEPSSRLDPATERQLDDLAPVINSIEWLSDQDKKNIFEDNQKVVFPRLSA